MEKGSSHPRKETVGVAPQRSGACAGGENAIGKKTKRLGKKQPNVKRQQKNLLDLKKKKKRGESIKASYFIIDF